MHQQQTAFENIVGKGEIARNKQFLLFPQCFQLNQIIVHLFMFLKFYVHLLLNCKKPKIGVAGNGLSKYENIQSSSMPILHLPT